MVCKGVCAAIKCYDCAYYSKNEKVGQIGCDDEFNEHNISTTECGGVCQVGHFKC